MSLAAGVALSAAVVATASATATATPGSPESAADTRPAAGPGGEVEVEYFTGPGGHPRHTRVPAAAPDRLTKGRGTLSPAQRAADGDVTPIVEKGPTADKVDVVFIGDGYTLDQQEDFHADVRAKWTEMSAVQPYAAYRDLFNVWSVDAVSRQSGVSGDPSKDVVKDTALKSYFWCDGLERLLCVDNAKVESYAVKAPAADLVVVLSNSAKYGGAGYNDVTSKPGYNGIATASSDNPDSDQVAVHETGHSLGKLADEYFYPEYGTYDGAEPTESNISELSAEQLKSQKKKWYRWIGQTSPDGGTVGAYEGGGYYPKGINRPTENSIMRTLGREFNLPGREAMIAGFYQHASVISSGTAKNTVLSRTTKLTVDIPDSAVITWRVDGIEVTAAKGRTEITPKSLGVRADGREHTITAKATDTTKSVKAPALRKLLTDTRSWKVKG
ncbi:M64 family metallopeptidase [Streptomyces sp. NPDC018031]|uniref:M64 family metallopeptidase n=1 Tax=Streptomyces sp. NPDC018031 TaxID=3365033 RepID=UPI0037961687